MFIFHGRFEGPKVALCQIQCKADKDRIRTCHDILMSLPSAGCYSATEFTILLIMPHKDTQETRFPEPLHKVARKTEIRVFDVRRSILKEANGNLSFIVTNF